MMGSFGAVIPIVFRILSRELLERMSSQDVVVCLFMTGYTLSKDCWPKAVQTIEFTFGRRATRAFLAPNTKVRAGRSRSELTPLLPTELQGTGRF